MGLHLGQSIIRVRFVSHPASVRPKNSFSRALSLVETILMPSLLLVFADMHFASSARQLKTICNMSRRRNLGIIRNGQRHHIPFELGDVTVHVYIAALVLNDAYPHNLNDALNRFGSRHNMFGARVMSQILNRVTDRALSDDGSGPRHHNALSAVIFPRSRLIRPSTSSFCQFARRSGAFSCSSLSPQKSSQRHARFETH